MKKVLFSKKFAAFAAFLALTGMFSFQAFAQPEAGPTGGNVDANFSSVTATSTSGTAITGNTTAGGGYAGVQGTGTTYGVSGIGTFGGSFNGSNTGVYGSVSSASGIGVRGDGKGSAAGVAGYNNDAVALATGVFGRALSATGYGARLEGGLYGLLAEAATAGGTAGWFRDFTGTNTAKLGTSTAAVDATGVIKNAGLTIDSNGDLSDSTGAVVINDNNGFQIIGGNPLSGVTGLQFTPIYSNDIAISAPQAGERVFINDAEGMDIRGPIRNWGAGTTPLKFDDDQGIQVTDGAGTAGFAVSVTGDITNPGPNTAAYNYGSVTIEDSFQVNGRQEIDVATGPGLLLYSYDGTTETWPAAYFGSYDYDSGAAIWADGGRTGIYATANGGSSGQDTAVFADGYNYGVRAYTGYTSTPNIAVLGEASWNAAGSIGVSGEGRAGVYGISNAPSSGGQGVYGESSPYSSNGVGVDGRGGNGTYTGVGVRGTGVGAGSQGGQTRYKSAPASGDSNVVDLSTSSYAINAGGTVRTYGTNNAMRLTGTGSYTSGAVLNFGDGDYVHISEPVDDAIEIKSNNFNVSSSGHATAAGGFGTYTTAWTSSSVGPGGTFNHVVYCPSGYTAISCIPITGMPAYQDPPVYFSTVQPYYTYCQTRGHNNSGSSTYTVQTGVNCYNPAV